MIPNVFVSSTIYDLQYLREAIRETIIELGYNPVMSDYGDIGYLPTKSAEDSCYTTVRDCQLAIGIIGKRYGEKAKNGFSVTHNEFLTIRERNIPLITIADQEVMSYKRVFDANKGLKTTPTFPGMDSPADTFNLVKSIMASHINNGIITYTTASDARKNLKSQIAHLFHELLSDQFNPLNSHIQDVLSEVKTLRHELLKNKGEEPIAYLQTMKWLLDSRDHGKHYSDLAKSLHGGLDVAVPIMLKTSSFDEFVNMSGYKIDIATEIPNVSAIEDMGVLKSLTFFTIYPYENKDEEDSGSILLRTDSNSIFMNYSAKEYFDFLHKELHKIIKENLTKHSTGLAQARR